MQRGMATTVAGLATAMALAACGGGGSTDGGSPAASVTSQAGGATPTGSVSAAAADQDTDKSSGKGSGKKTTAKVDKTVYFAGYQVQVKSLAYTPAGADDYSTEPNLVLQATVTNLGDQSQDLSSTSMEIDLASGNHHWRGELPDTVSVPGKASSDTTIGFSVDKGFSVDSGVLTFGSADLAQSVLPLGGTGDLADNAPTSVPVGDPITAKGKESSVTVKVTGGELRADYPGEFNQAKKGHRVLVLRYDATLDAKDPDATVPFSYADLSITDQDGNTVSAYDSSSAQYTDAHILTPGKATHFVAEFALDEPGAGAAYTLTVRHEDSQVGLGGSTTSVIAGKGPLTLT